MLWHETQDPSQAATEGVDAYCLGQPIDSCPYADGKQDAADWLAGWQEAAEIDREQRDGDNVIPLRAVRLP